MLKRILQIGAFLLLPAVAVSAQGFEIKGNIPGLVSGSVQILRPTPGIQFEKVRIENGQFVFKGTVDHPTVVQLKISTKSFFMFLENKPYKVNVPFDSLKGESIIGGMYNLEYHEYKAAFKEPMVYLKAHPYLQIAPWLATQADQNAETAVEGYNLLSAIGKASYYGQELANRIEGYKTRAAGTVYPDFKLTDASGKTFSVSDFKGKYVVIDYWASWCAPCVAYIPKLRELYHQYKDKNVVFLSISLDDDAQKWQAGMEAHKMEWYQGLAEGGFTDQGLRKTFNIKGIPYVMVVGKDGKIVANMDYAQKVKLPELIAELVKK
ncbi:uncharacterized protein DUF4369 [Chitinophaga skermanii]|uniref:Uncharacterized protein DUF4369 n=1 Tax=Chitinophaga skermanii TaxID=331697 RepID=A0A327QUG7_9BACT|nr:TlpA disulfide reductase family protein [Chitinophaga skermanii]RAJ08249.1 uncharacterized protein DUF4369 [Chitinophaga skermanii]